MHWSHERSLRVFLFFWFRQIPLKQPVQASLNTLHDLSEFLGQTTQSDPKQQRILSAPKMYERLLSACSKRYDGQGMLSSRRRKQPPLHNISVYKSKIDLVLSYLKRIRPLKTKSPIIKALMFQSFNSKDIFTVSMANVSFNSKKKKKN